jgi:hypothetical protein
MDDLIQKRGVENYPSMSTLAWICRAIWAELKDKFSIILFSNKEKRYFCVADDSKRLVTIPDFAFERNRYQP